MVLRTEMNNSLYTCSYCPSSPMHSEEAVRLHPLLIGCDSKQIVELLTQAGVDMCHNQPVRSTSAPWASVPLVSSY